MADDEGADQATSRPLPASEMPTAGDPGHSTISKIGQYVLLREIGKGGMGMVYLGARADQEFKKQVAIKIIRRGMNSDQIVARFRRERQILASLDHPNIAKLLDGGTTEDNLPYFVMEHIQGRPLTEYCDKHKLTIRERLELFRTVCSAVQYAHQNLVVHRDLKPANILVTTDGMPKLLDFGIAKFLNPDVFSDEIPPTATGLFVMTPEYASPEQARGDPITTASDIYSLGVILYELLSGTRPYHFTSRNQLEFVQVIVEREPEKPSNAITKIIKSTADQQIASRGATPAKLQKQLRGDLDNIILLALRKEPQRRYASAAALSEDIRMHLEGLPVHARKGTWQYRAGKYVRRHKAAVTVAAVLFMLLSMFAVATRVQNVQISAQRDIAEQQKAKAEAESKRAEEVTQFLINLFEVNDPLQSKGQSITARQILDKGAKRVKTELSDQQEIQMQLLLVIGQIYYKMELYDEAQAHLKEALQQATKLHGQESPEVTKIMRALAAAIFDFKEFKTQEAILRQALAIDRKLYGENHLNVAMDLHQLAINQDFQGLEGAEQLSRQALAIRREISTKDEVGLADNLVALGEIVHSKGDLQEAESLKREALALFQKHFPAEHPSIATCLDGLGRIFHDKGNFEEAGKYYRQALQLSRKIYGNESEAVAVKLNNLGFVQYDKGDFVAAKKNHLEALAIRRKLFGEETWEVAQSTTNLAFVIHAMGDFQESEKLHRRGLDIWRKVVGDNHFRIARSSAGLGEALLAQGKITEAILLLKAALLIPEDTLPADHRYRAEVKSTLGACLTSQKSFEEAEGLLIPAHQILAIKMKGSRIERQALQHVVDLYHAWGKPEIAEQYLRNKR